MSFPYIFTFYSFKGGVGRSMAAANVAYALASRGRNVLLMDMDLEAPGLSTFFHKSKEVEEKSPLDVLDLLGWADGWVKTHPGEYPDLDAIAKEGPNIGGFFLPVPREKVPKPRLGEADFSSACSLGFMPSTSSWCATGAFQTSKCYP